MKVENRSLTNSLRIRIGGQNNGVDLGKAVKPDTKVFAGKDHCINTYVSGYLGYKYRK
jgi:hypothetical protein